MEIGQRERECLKRSIEAAGYTAEDTVVARFIRFYKLLIEKNKVMNLTAITEYKDVVDKHFADSLLVKGAFDELIKDGMKLPDISRARIADMGTGAGFPGIPLKICNPDADIVLMDSLRKRIDFINEVAGELDLKGLTAVHGRGEDLGRDKMYREGFDLVVSRAVASLAVLAEYCLPLLKKDGYFVAYKSGEIEEEVENAAVALKVLGGDRAVIKKMALPGTDIVRSFVLVKKIKPTTSKYPRKAGVPAKSPIK